MKILIFFLTIISLISCDSKKEIPFNETKKENQQKEVIELEPNVDLNEDPQGSPASCENCQLVELEIKPYNLKKNELCDFNRPVAIEFFYVFSHAIKYDRIINKDSIPEKLNHPNRQEIYTTINDYGGYTTYMMEELKLKNIEIIKGDINNETVTFNINNNIYSFSTTQFLNDDGIVFFQPGKTPVLYSFLHKKKECSNKIIIDCYYE